MSFIGGFTVAINQLMLSSSPHVILIIFPYTGNDEEDEDVEDEGDAEDNDDRTSSSPPLLEATHLSLVPTGKQKLNQLGGKQKKNYVWQDM